MIKGKAYPTLVVKVLVTELHFEASEEGWETTDLIISLDILKKIGRFIILRVLKYVKNKALLFFLFSDEYGYSFYITNTDLLPEEVVDLYQKRGNSENCIKETKYDMSFGNILLKSF